MKFLNMILFTTLVILSTMLTATVSATISDDHCFDHDLENSFCYKTQKECEIERKNDLMAEGKCYSAIE
ncbi:MAG TPA: hypothetical protein VJS91_01850 [Nitrososphaeraceae archaeon]|nr:hypothetical protein [Nitrososphaeraceae archaeon]